MAFDWTEKFPSDGWKDTLCDWLENLVQHNYIVRAHCTFSRATPSCPEFWLVHLIAYVCFDWCKQLLLFHSFQLKFDLKLRRTNHWNRQSIFSSVLWTDQQFVKHIVNIKSFNKNMFWMVHFLLREAGFFPETCECISSGQLHQLSSFLDSFSSVLS